jgi:hypothetical protein
MGFSVRLNLDDGAGGVGDTLISGTGGGVKVFLGRSSIVLIVGTAGEVTALESGRGAGVGWLEAPVVGCVTP